MSSTVKKTEYPFSASELRTVCAAYAAEQVAITAEVQNAFSPSEAHAAAIEYLVKHSQKKAGRRDFFLKFAAAAAAFIIIFSTALATNVHAREAFVNWIRQIFPDHVLYQFTGEDQSGPDQYSIGWIPEGFILTDSDADDRSEYYIYEKAEQMVIIEFRKAGSLEYTEFSGYEQAILTDATINGKETFIYQDSNSDKVNLTIFDREKGYLIEIDTNIGAEATIRIAENIYYNILIRVTMGWVPDGFTMTESGEDADESYYIFENDGKGFIIECCSLSKYDVLDIDDYDSIEDVKIGTKPASLYMNSNSGINVLIIVDESRQLIVSINGTLDREALIHLGESINYK